MPLTPAKIYNDIYQKSRKSINEINAHSIGTFLLKMNSKPKVNSGSYETPRKSCLK